MAWSAARRLGPRVLLAAGSTATILAPPQQGRQGLGGQGPARCDGMMPMARRKGRFGEVAEVLKAQDQETWPWMWLSRNPAQKCHVFVGNSPELLEKVKQAAAQDRNATMVLVGKREELLRSTTPEELDQMKCAFLEGSVERVDAHDCIIMTRDERMLEFDSLTIMWKAPRSKSGRRITHEVPTGAKSEDGLLRHHHPHHQDHDDDEEDAAHRASRVLEIYPSRGRRLEDVQVAGGCRSIVKRKSLHAGGESLHQVVEAWKLSRTETWPWVWLWRTSQGPVHVLVGSSREVFLAARQRAADSPNNNIVIIGRRSELLHHAPEAEYDRLGCAIVELDLEELDAAHGIAMLADERLLEFDTLTVFHAESSATV